MSAAYRHAFSDRMQGFVQAGMKWSRARRDVSSFGLTFQGRSDALFGSVAAGLSGQLSDKAGFAASMHGDFTEDTTAIGGKVRFRISF